MESLIVQRWTQAGHDRLYVKTAGGYRVGYLDRPSGARVLEDDAWRGAFDAAIAQFEATISTSGSGSRSKRVPSGSPAAPIAPVAPVAPEAPWHDLALNTPGHGVRAKAKELQDSAPIATFVARVIGAHTDERAWRLGDNGEVAVAKELARLDSWWRTLHSVPVGIANSDIDHVVIGPGGIFTVNSKNHPDAKISVRGDAFWVNGRHHAYVRNSRYEASRASKLLTQQVGFSVPVTGLIAIYGARGGCTIHEQPDDGKVKVVTRVEIAKWLSRRPPILRPDQLDVIYAAARKSTTWTAPTADRRRR
jgi:hypothetical protein